MYARVEKCYFSMDTVEYLGYILSPEGLSMDESKVEVIKNWPILAKSRTYNPFSDLPTSTGVSFTNIWTSLFP
jgi:hypothetical protein